MNRATANRLQSSIFGTFSDSLVRAVLITFLFAFFAPHLLGQTEPYTHCLAILNVSSVGCVFLFAHGLVSCWPGGESQQLRKSLHTHRWDGSGSLGRDRATFKIWRLQFILNSSSIPPYLPGYAGGLTRRLRTVYTTRRNHDLRHADH